MERLLICPKTGRVCFEPVCEEINSHYDNAIGRIRRRVSPERWNKVKKYLTDEIEIVGKQLGAELNPDIDTAGNCTICPQDVLRSSYGRKLGPDVVSLALCNIADETLLSALNDLEGQNP